MDSISIKPENINKKLVIDLKFPSDIPDINFIILENTAHNIINIYAGNIIWLPDFKSYLTSLLNMQIPP